MKRKIKSKVHDRREARRALATVLTAANQKVGAGDLCQLNGSFSEHVALSMRDLRRVLRAYGVLSGLDRKIARAIDLGSHSEPRGIDLMQSVLERAAQDTKAADQDPDSQDELQE